MKLPFLNNIIIEDKKIEKYLLNINHPDGRIKAKFLIDRNFNKNSLKSMLVKQAKERDVKEIKKSEFGTKYIIESDVECPDKKIILFRSVWIVYINENFVKLVTAYPIK